MATPCGFLARIKRKLTKFAKEVIQRRIWRIIDIEEVAERIYNVEIKFSDIISVEIAYRRRKKCIVGRGVENTVNMIADKFCLEMIDDRREDSKNEAILRAQTRNYLRRSDKCYPLLRNGAIQRCLVATDGKKENWQGYD